MNYKNIYMALFFLVGGVVSSYAQDINPKDVPAVVKNTFAKMYPKATDVEWEMKVGNYQTSFDLGKVDHKATFTKNGQSVSFEKDIANNQLPAIIAKNIKAKYPNATIDDVDWINTGGKITYKIDIEGKPDLNVWYTADGKFIKDKVD